MIQPQRATLRQPSFVPYGVQADRNVAGDFWCSINRGRFPASGFLLDANEPFV